MTRHEKKREQTTFLKKAVLNAETFKEMMDEIPDVAMYIKDMDGRIMALNRRNCDISNMRDDLDAFGRRSDEIFPDAIAQSYVAHDKIVFKTRRPLVNYRDEYAADFSTTTNRRSIFPLFDRKGRMVGIAGLYYRNTAADGAPDWHGFLKPVTEYIGAHYAEDITLEMLAGMVATSLTNFRRQFTRTFGISPGRYITTIRLNAARRLLETTDKLVSEIAVETGFWDQSHLTKTFNHVRGITPREYRRRHRQA